MKRRLMTQTHLSSDTGRSMVEMLGVLAIMGVLSVGGIAGYNYAIDRYRVNETMDELNRRAVMYAIQLENGQLSSGTVLSNGEFGNRTSLGYGAEGYVSSDTGYFEIALQEVPSSVCRGLVRDYTTPVLIDVNGTEYETPSDEWEACGEEILVPEMAFVYARDLDNSAVAPDRSDVGDDPFATVCDEGFYHDVNTGECVEDTYCPAGKFWDSANGGSCSVCPTEGNPVVIPGDSDWMGGYGETSCGKCSGSSVVTPYNSCGYACLYCPSPRMACDKVCCEEGLVCRGIGDGSWSTPTCVLPDCQSDSDCTDAAKPLCDTVSGQCFAGCRINADCSVGEYCDLNIEAAGGGCVHEPGQGTCKSLSYSSIPGTKYVYGSSMNWWSAQNFCKALNKDLIDLRKTCSNWSELKSNQGGQCPELTLGMNAYWGWSKTRINSCRPFTFGLNGYVGVDFLDHYTLSVLCE